MTKKQQGDQKNKSRWQFEIKVNEKVIWRGNHGAEKNERIEPKVKEKVWKRTCGFFRLNLEGNKTTAWQFSSPPEGKRHVDQIFTERKQTKEEKKGESDLQPLTDKLDGIPRTETSRLSIWCSSVHEGKRRERAVSDRTRGIHRMEGTNEGSKKKIQKKIMTYHNVLSETLETHLSFRREISNLYHHKSLKKKKLI